MEIKQLECFVNLAETLNFSQTAQQLYLSQPAVTGQIKSLENELNVILFQRNRRSVKLTPAGQVFYHDVKRILESLYNAINRTKYEADQHLEKYVILYEDNSLAVHFLSKLICQFRKVHPEISVELKIANELTRKQLYHDHMIDFMFTVDEGLNEYENLAFEPLYQGKYVCVVSKNHHLTKKRSFSFSDFKNEHLVLLNPVNAPQEMKRLIEQITKECRHSSIQFCDSVFSGYTLVKSGMGMAIMPDFVCLDDQETEMIPVSGCEKLVYGVAWNRQYTSDDRKDFVRIAKEIYSKKT